MPDTVARRVIGGLIRTLVAKYDFGGCKERSLEQVEASKEKRLGEIVIERGTYEEKKM